MKIPDLNILRIYGQEIECKTFPIPDQMSAFRSKKMSAYFEEEDIFQDICLHHVIRSSKCEFANEIKKFDYEFKQCIKEERFASPQQIRDFQKVFRKLC